MSIRSFHLLSVTQVASCGGEQLWYNKGMGVREKFSEGNYQAVGATEHFVHVQPEKVTKKCKVVIAPGMGETDVLYKKPAEALAERGFDTYAFAHTVEIPDSVLQPILDQELARVRKEYAGKLPPKLLEGLVANVKLTEFRKAFALKEFIRTKVQSHPGEKVDVVGHSQGGAYATIAAFLWPEMFDHAVLMNSAGHSGKEDYRKMRSRFTFGLIGDTVSHPLEMTKAAFATMMQILRHGYFSGKLINEAKSLALFNAFAYIAALKGVGPHIKVLRMYDKHDVVFPEREVLKEEARAEKEHGKGSLGKRIITNLAGHYSFLTRPKVVARLIEEQLAA